MVHNNNIIGAAVSSGLFDLAQSGDQVPVNISQLEAQNAAVVMEYLMNENLTIVNDTAYLDGQSLCFGNVSMAVRDAIVSVVPIEPVCGKCGKLIVNIIYCTCTSVETLYVIECPNLEEVSLLTFMYSTLCCWDHV